MSLQSALPVDKKGRPRSRRDQPEQRGFCQHQQSALACAEADGAHHAVFVGRLALAHALGRTVAVERLGYGPHERLERRLRILAAFPGQGLEHRCSQGQG
jgi:hypothetical protein